MIPKVIHYCWFGRNPLPESAKKCIASWRKFLPDYEIIEWNEDNYDVNKIPYTAEAYAAKKYAFVSDYARFDILYQHGGLYFDTDVEVIKPFDDIVANGPFMGIEVPPNKNSWLIVAPGLCLGAEKKMTLYKDILVKYQNLHFTLNDGSFNTYTVGQHTTDILKLYGLKNENTIQTLNDTTVIYPKYYFNPLDDATGKLTITTETHSIHWYSKSWCDSSPLRTKISRLSHRMFGTKLPALILKATGLRTK
jgi:hypothetical protein